MDTISPSIHPAVREAIRMLVERWGEVEIGIIHFRTAPTCNLPFAAFWMFPEGDSIVIDVTNGFRPTVTWFNQFSRVHRDVFPAFVTMTQLRYYTDGDHQYDVEWTPSANKSLTQSADQPVSVLD